MDLESVARQYETLGLTKEEVYSKYQEFLQKYGDEKRALRATVLSLKKVEFSLKETKLFRGFFIAREDTVDILERRREKALRLYSDENTRDEAIARELVTPDGIPLWKGRPIQGSLLVKRAWALATDDGYWWPMRVSAMGELVHKLDSLPLFKPVEFRARLRRDFVDITRLTIFREIEVPWVIGDVLESGKGIPCMKVSEVLDTPINSFDKTRPICMLGWAITIRRVDIKYVDLTDEDATGYIRCFLRIDHPLDFGENSKVFVVGYPAPSIRGNGYVFRTYGLYADPRERTEPD